MVIHVASLEHCGSILNYTQSSIHSSHLTSCYLTYIGNMLRVYIGMWLT